jgi:hypothetical protein
MERVLVFSTAQSAYAAETGELSIHTALIGDLPQEVIDYCVEFALKIRLQHLIRKGIDSIEEIEIVGHKIKVSLGTIPPEKVKALRDSIKYLGEED